MKVLMTADAVGGVWSYALDLARGLASRGAEVVLAVMGPAPSRDQLREATGIHGLDIRHGPFALEWMDDPWDDVDAAALWLREVEAAESPDVVHLNGYAHAAGPFAAPVVVAAHSSVNGWWHAVYGAAPPIAFRGYAQRVSRGLAAADVVVAPTHDMLNELGRHFGPIDAASFVIPNGRSTFAAPGDKAPEALWVGRVWDEAKAAAVFDAAAARGVPWRMLVVGDPERPDGRRSPPLCHAQGLGRVSRGELADRLGRAALFVSTARYEPFGLGALEAAQAGCTLVLPRLPSLAETWDGAAWFYRPGDDVELAAALRTLAARPAHRARLAHAASARARTLTPEAMADAYLGVYRRVAAEPVAEEVDVCAS